jgi:hypothetical protein
VENVTLIEVKVRLLLFDMSEHFSGQMSNAYAVLKPVV